MNLTPEDIQAIVAAVMAAQSQKVPYSDMPISNNQKFGKVTVSAQSEKEVPFLGSYVAIFSNTASTDVLISMDNGISNFIKAGTGYPVVRLSPDKKTYEPATFNKVRFHNTSDESMTIEYVLSLGPITDTRAVIEGFLQVDLSGSSVSTPAPLAVGTDPANPSVLAANALVKERLVVNTGDYTIWWGDSSVNPAAGRGTPIFPSGSVSLSCHGVIYFVAQDADSTLSINEIMKG